jgi:glycosyltransferase involved in cell wall biosynthesis
MPLSDIAAAIITRDAAETLAATLDSLIDLPEVVIYDNGSTDQTEEIARRYTNVRFIRGEFLGFGPTKNKAAELAEHDWIFSIDADEQASPELIRELASLSLADPKMLYETLRQNFMLGKHVRHSGWGRDWLPRIYHREQHRYNDANVHEKIIPRADSQVVRLKSPLRHDAVRDLGSFLVKIDRYTAIRAADAVSALPTIVVYLKSLWAFFRVYLLQAGFLDGWRGLVIAWSDATGVFFKYMRAVARFKGNGRDS